MWIPANVFRIFTHAAIKSWNSYRITINRLWKSCTYLNIEKRERGFSSSHINAKYNEYNMKLARSIAKQNWRKFKSVFWQTELSRVFTENCYLFIFYLFIYLFIYLFQSLFLILTRYFSSWTLILSVSIEGALQCSDWLMEVDNQLISLFRSAWKSYIKKHKEKER